MLIMPCIYISRDRRVTKGEGSQIISCRARSERGNSGSSNNSYAHMVKDIRTGHMLDVNEPPLGQACGAGEAEGGRWKEKDYIASDAYHGRCESRETRMQKLRSRADRGCE